MSLHQQLQRIQAQREREERHPESKKARKWPSPLDSKTNPRKRLSLRGEKPNKEVNDRGPLRIHMADRKGGHESIIERPMVRPDEHRIEEIVDSRLESLKKEMPLAAS